MQAQKILTLAGNIVISVGFLDILEVWEDMDELKGKEIQAKDERVHIVTDVTFFKEDAFNQSKYAVTADSGLYLYPREFILVN